MRDRTGGVIINIGSGASKVPFANLASYTASKGAIEMFTRVAAIELGPHKVRVNCVAPGVTATPMLREPMADGAHRARMEDAALLGRIAEPREIAEAIVWLLSPRASFVEGETLTVDGGLMLD